MNASLLSELKTANEAERQQFLHDLLLHEAVSLIRKVLPAGLICQSAGREIRQTVRAHKVRFGSQSVAGAKMRETWMSLFARQRKRAAHPVEKLADVLPRKAQEPHLVMAAALFGQDTG